MPNLDRIFLNSYIARTARTRQFMLRMDALKDQEQDDMWDFIHESRRKRNKKTRDKIEKEQDVNSRHNIRSNQT